MSIFALSNEAGKINIPPAIEPVTIHPVNAPAHLSGLHLLRPETDLSPPIYAEADLYFDPALTLEQKMESPRAWIAVPGRMEIPESWKMQRADTQRLGELLTDSPV